MSKQADILRCGTCGHQLDDAGCCRTCDDHYRRCVPRRTQRKKARP